MYGVFRLDGFTIAVLVIVALALLAVAGMIYRSFEPLIMGFIAHLAGGVVSMILLITWWTATHWSLPDSDAGFGVVMGSIFLLAGITLGPPLARQ